VILDSSVLIAILRDEPERDAFREKIGAADSVGVAAPTLVETGIVLSRGMGEDAGQLLDRFLAASDIVVIDFGADQWREAISAWWRFGRSRHPARLNFGDCIAYATARRAGQPLLAKGDGFPKTDIQLA
jgi:ribonuclease VapC